MTASFLAGVLALFAPCCITFLFPSYLATIFKEKKKVMYYTLIFALGLSFVLVPVAIGFRFIVFFLDDFHRQIYYVGAVIMILMGMMTIKPLIHLPTLFQFNRPVDQKIDTVSVFGLGLMSGVTSSCCAPVLLAAVTLTSLSPSILQALIVSLSYVMGIVAPLFIMSLFYQKTAGKILSGVNRQKIYHIFRALGATIFFVAGVLIAVFNYLGKIEMNQMESYGAGIRMVVFQVAKYFQNPVIDITVFVIIIYLFIKLLRSCLKEDKQLHKTL